MFKKIALLMSLWMLARFCHHQTEGFRLSKLQGNTTILNEQVSEPMPPKMENLLHQKFHYLGRGIQSFSFVSEDGKTVLKLFNNRYQSKIFWLKKIPFFGFIQNKISYNKKKLAWTFASYQIAYDKLKEESGLLYFHPQKTSKTLPVTLIDKLHIAHTIDLNQMGFALQKKAVLAYPYLDSCTEKEAKEALFSLVRLLKRKMDLGIGDRDPLIRANVGFLENRPMQIDIGPLYLDSAKKNPIQEITKMTLGLKHWLEKAHPEMAPFLDEAIQNL